MLAASLVLELGTLLLYRKSQVDVLGLNAIKALLDAQPRPATERLVRCALERSGWIVFVTLSLVSHPFVVTAYFGNQSELVELRRRDWALFMSSFVLGHAAWILPPDARNSGGAQVRVIASDSRRDAVNRSARSGASMKANGRGGLA